MYSVLLMAALTTGGDSAALGRHHGCESSCGCEGGRRHHRGGCESSCGSQSCGYQSYGCQTCGAAPMGAYSGCPTCGHAYAAPVGCSTCANGLCSLDQPAVNTATIVVSLPADAKLTIDDAATTSTSDHRVFVSPGLPAGQEFHYTLKAEINVNGKSTVVSQVVAVRAGQATEVTLAAPTGVAER